MKPTTWPRSRESGFVRTRLVNTAAIFPTNLYGPVDNFHADTSHLPAALLRRFHDAKAAGAPDVVVWGSGTPRREFLYVDDLADASIHVMQHYSDDPHVNIGAGYDLTISEFAAHIQHCVGFKGQITYDRSRPDGMPRKLLDSRRLQSLGWSPKTSLEEGLRMYYDWFLSNQGKLREINIGAEAGSMSR